MEDNNSINHIHDFYQPPKILVTLPQTHIASKESHTWYHLTGRIGRLRYVSYLVLMFMSFMMVAIFIAMIFEKDYIAFMMVMFVT